MQEAQRLAKSQKQEASKTKGSTDGKVAILYSMSFP